jgi:hypothetical protein
LGVGHSIKAGTVVVDTLASSWKLGISRCSAESFDGNTDGRHLALGLGVETGVGRSDFCAGLLRRKHYGSIPLSFRPGTGIQVGRSGWSARSFMPTYIMHGK